MPTRRAFFWMMVGLGTIGGVTEVLLKLVASTVSEGGGNEASEPGAADTDGESNESTPTQTLTQTPTPTSTPAPSTPTLTATPVPDAVILYEVTASKSPAVVPSKYRSRRRSGYIWIVVTVYVVKGRIDMGELWNHSRLIAPRGTYEVDHNTAYLESGIKPRGSITADNSRIILYQLPIHQADSYQWSIEQVDSRFVVRKR